MTLCFDRKWKPLQEYSFLKFSKENLSDDLL